MRQRRRNYTPEEIRSEKEANTKADAYNAGWRRGFRGQPCDDGSRFSRHPAFAEGYAAGEKSRT